MTLADMAHATEPLLPQGKAYETRDSGGAVDRYASPTHLADWHRGITAILIKTDDGAILIDGGLAQAADMLLAHMLALGVAPGDLKLILNSHAHADHAGAIRAVQRATGARLLNTAESAVLMAHGGSDDIHFGDDILYPPVQTDRILHDREVVVLGDIRLTAHLTCRPYTRQPRVDVG